MKFLYYINLFSHRFNHLILRCITLYLKVLCGMLLIALMMLPVIFFWEHEEFVIYWFIGVFVVALFGLIFLFIYIEVSAPEIIETTEDITFINEAKPYTRNGRIKTALLHTVYWFLLALVIIAYGLFLLLRMEE